MSKFKSLFKGPLLITFYAFIIFVILGIIMVAFWLMNQASTIAFIGGTLLLIITSSTTVQIIINKYKNK
jgi:hypothetical protein